MLAYVEHIYLKSEDLFEKQDGKIYVKNPAMLVHSKIHLLYSFLFPDDPIKAMQLDPETILYFISEKKIVDFLIISYNRTLCPVPEYKSARVPIDRDVLYAPPSSEGAPMIVSIEEWGFMDQYYIAYKRTDNIKYLDLMLCIIYRRKNGGVREAFSKDTADDTIPIIQTWPLQVKIAILIWFEGVRALDRKKYPFIYSEANEKQAEDSTWMNIFLAMAGTKFGTYEQTLLTDKDVFMTEQNTLCKKANK